MPTPTPLLIIGAGPAGLSTALHLLQRDPTWRERMLVLEKAAHPRHKLCGWGITRFGLQHLEGLGLPLPLPIPHAVVRDARFVYRGRVVHVRGDPEFVVFHRQEFDHYLAGVAKERGVQILEGERALKMERQDGQVAVTTERTTYFAQAVVGADGSRGITRSALRDGARITRAARLLEGVHPAAEFAPTLGGEYALFDFTPVDGSLQGYVWDFPSRIEGRPHHNRGIYDARVAQLRPRADLPGLLNQALDEMGTPGRELRLEGHPIHWFSPASTISGERILLVGDAAGAEPLFGEGIATALAYGKTAAAAIEAAFNSGNFSFREYKTRVLGSRLGAYLMLRWTIAWWSYRLSGNAWFMHIMWTIGSGLAALKRG